MRSAARPVLLAAALVAAFGCGSSKTSEGFKTPLDAGSDSPSLFNNCGHADCDGDGYSTAQGDCNDADPSVNPEAYDFPGDGVDNDCDGKTELTRSSPARPSHWRWPPARPPTSRARPTSARKTPSRTAARSSTPSSTPSGARSRASAAAAPSGRPPRPSATRRSASASSFFGGNVARLGKTMAGLSNGPWETLDPRSAGPHRSEIRLQPPRRLHRHPAGRPRLRVLAQRAAS